MSITIVKERKDGIAYYAVQATGTDGKERLCWNTGRHFYFADKKKGYKTPLPPALFVTKKEAMSALDNIPKRNGNTKQFTEVVDCKKVRIVKVYLDVI